MRIIYSNNSYLCYNNKNIYYKLISIVQFEYNLKNLLDFNH